MAAGVPSPPIHDEHRLAYLLFGALAAALVVTIVVAVTSVDGGRSGSDATASAQRGPAFWTVHRGDTYAKIAANTGLSMDDLIDFNPKVNPNAIVPGQRLKLRLHVPPPKPKPKGPRLHTVRTGQTFSSIARQTHHDVNRLRKLNPKLKTATLQPGDRMRLRR